MKDGVCLVCFLRETPEKPGCSETLVSPYTRTYGPRVVHDHYYFTENPLKIYYFYTTTKILQSSRHPFFYETTVTLLYEFREWR